MSADRPPAAPGQSTRAATDPRPVLLVTGHVPPDRLPAMRALHAAEGLEIAIYDGRLHHATPGVADPGVPSRRLRQRAVRRLAAAGGHRAVIATSAGRIALPAAYAGARRARVPFLYWTGIWADIRTPAHRAGAPLVRRIERRADAVITYGEHVSAYVRSHGATNVHVAPQSVDVAFWSAPGDAAAGRALAPGEGLRAAFAGRHAPGKGLPELLAAWERSGLAARGGTLALAGIAPDGVPAPEGARSAGPGRATVGGVHALGSLHPEQLRNLFAAADVLLVPSVPTRAFREPWGLVVNEAMLQSTAVIATDAVGAAAGGLVRDGVTGLVVPAGDPGALALAMHRLEEDHALRERLAGAGAAAAARLSPEACAAGVSAALASLSASRNPC